MVSARGSQRNSVIELEPMNLSSNMMFEQPAPVIIDQNQEEPIQFENGWTAVQNDKFLSDASSIENSLPDI